MQAVAKTVLTLLCLLPAACSPVGSGEKGAVYRFEECSRTTLSELFGSCSVRRIGLQDPDSLLSWAEAAVFRVYDRCMVACQPFGAARGVRLYAADGSFLGPVGRIGRGPGEYLFPTNVWTDPACDTLYVEDRGMNSVLTYALPERRFVGSERLPLHALCMTRTDSGSFLHYVSAANRNDRAYPNLVATDRAGRTTPVPTGTVQRDRYSGLWQTTTLFHATPDGWAVHHQFQPEILSAADGRTIARLKFDRHRFAPETFDWGNEGFRERIAASPYIQYYDLFETAEQLHVRFCAAGHIYLGMYDKRSARGTYCRADRIADDLGAGCVPRIRSVHDGRFYALRTSGDAAPAVIEFARSEE